MRSSTNRHAWVERETECAEKEMEHPHGCARCTDDRAVQKRGSGSAKTPPRPLHPPNIWGFRWRLLLQSGGAEKRKERRNESRAIAKNLPNTLFSGGLPSRSQSRMAMTMKRGKKRTGALSRRHWRIPFLSTACRDTQ